MQVPSPHQQPHAPVAQAPVATVPTVTPPAAASYASPSGNFAILIITGLALLVVGIFVSELPDIQGEPSAYDYDMADSDDVDKYAEDLARHPIYEDQMQGLGSVIKGAAGAVLVYAMVAEGVGKGNLSNGVKITLVAGSALIASQFFGFSIF